MIKTLLVALAITIVFTAPSADKMASVPGYPEEFNTSVYSGYLDLKNENRSAHYVFVEAAEGSGNQRPLTLWLNGGPGCSSLLGFLQQIGPYYLQDGKNYKQGDMLTKNPHSWHQISNLLFLESPAGVGFSYNLDTTFEYNDAQTAHDNLEALISFYNKFPEYKNRGLWLAGESYAGKYIPDLAELILGSNDYNNTNIKLKGMLIGNGIMSFEHLQRSEIEYMIGRGFSDPETIQYWKSSCQFDPQSAGCRYFLIRFQEDIEEINRYNVYGYCYYNDSFDSNRTNFESEASILRKLKRQFNEKAYRAGSAKNVDSLIYTTDKSKMNLQELAAEEKETKARYNGAPCAYFDGIYNYFNIHEKAYNAKFPDMKWNGPCAQNITYHINPAGSMNAYRYLLSRQTNRMQIVLYNGNWDVMVPYVDTVKNIKALNLEEAYIYHPWFVGDQHAGFSQLYSGLLFLTVKGASHQVPQSQRAAALQLFNDTLTGHPEFEHLPETLRFE